MGFLKIGILDIIDILVVAFLLYQVYILIKGTVAIKIFTGVALIYLIWLIVKALKMQLLSTILGHVMGVGVIALLIVFQQEIRKFAIFISNKYISRFDFSLSLLFSNTTKLKSDVKVWAIVKATIRLSKTKTGGLIVITKRYDLFSQIETGIKLNADTTSLLIENIFAKNTPLHDGAVIITNEKIIAAKCILPVSQNKNLPEEFGLRHRSAFGLSEQTDAIIIAISEENGKISVFKHENYTLEIKAPELMKFLEKEFLKNSENK